VKPRDVLAAPDAEPAVTAPLLRTAEWMAGYYGAPVGLALRAMLPAPLWGESEVLLVAEGGAGATGGTAGTLLEWLDRRGGTAPIRTAERALRKPLWAVADRLVRVGALRLETRPPPTRAGQVAERALELSGPRLSLLGREDRFGRAPAQRRLYEALEQATGPVPVTALRERFGVSPAVMRVAVDAGWAAVVELERLRDPFAGLEATPPPARLTPAQVAALGAIAAVPPGGAGLVFGVTGSGKTLVYLEAIRRAVEAGQGAIVLVPEIGLTPQTVARVRGMFGDQVAVLHSALSDGERADAWRLLRRGERRVAVGPRSAVFAPVPRLAFVVVDEEHEASYKSGETPRYHARDVARVRCRLEGARLVLGSATPAVETAARVGTDLTLVRLPARVGERPLPPVDLVDLRSAPLVEGVGGMPWSVALDDALRAALARGEQALLLLNRRGYAAFVHCPSCGDVRRCPRCSISMTLHRSPSLLRCHYCDHHEPFARDCPACGHPLTRARGVGTQQVEQVAAERLPGARIARMDLDTTTTRWSHHRILDRVGRGEVDLLVGTQMVAKGIDFPNVTVVGVVDADTALHLPDFRAAERTFQLLTQVAGRAGRGPRGGRVLVQTRNPEHFALRLAQRHDTEGFWAAEIAARQEPPYPPATALVNVVVSGPAEAAASREATAVADWLGRLLAARQLPVTLLGPAPCPVVRVKDRWRWHVVLKGPGDALGAVVRYAAPRLTSRTGARVTVDRDPVSLL
jgi:primosomal protein N' (replication factor Y) (superfamily II helicase)